MIERKIWQGGTCLYDYGLSVLEQYGLTAFLIFAFDTLVIIFFPQFTYFLPVLFIPHKRRFCIEIPVFSDSDHRTVCRD